MFLEKWATLNPSTQNPILIIKAPYIISLQLQEVKVHIVQSQVRNSDTWRFMGSYKLGYKYNIGYNHSYPTYNLQVASKKYLLTPASGASIT